MPKGSKELTEARKEEIITACEKLYETMSFKDITIKEIGKATSFTRTSVYNYFQTKEEIFLAILQREYEKWVDELSLIEAEHDALSINEFADKIAKSLEHRKLLLKLMTMNNYDMEENSRLENLTEFKMAYGKSINALDRCFAKFTSFNETKRKEILYIFLPFVYN